MNKIMSCLLLGFLLTACVSTDNADAKKLNVTSSNIGKASYYGPGFHGRPTSSGEKFDSRAMTAAHLSYPFGTKIRVTNLANDRSAIFRINDRGPHIKGRILDVSTQGAKSLGFISQGVATVKIERLAFNQ